jgi:probable phosphomutase (TIGR03848 family)/uncharacterized repeat protein (TIGR03847 family)
MATKRKPPPATLVLLVRHGQTPTTGASLPGRAPGLHLSDAGRDQAELVAKRLAELPRVDAVYSSPLERTRETAAPIAAARGMKVHVDRGLLECDFGEWTGQPLKQLMKDPSWATVQRYPSGFRFPDGESFLEMQVRLVASLERLRARHEGGVVVAVSHADPIKAAVAHALGTHLDLFQRIVISPCSVTAIGYHSGGPVVLTVNSTGGSLAELRPVTPSYDLGDVDAFTTGAIGRPGERVFYLQVRDGRDVVTFKCEKQQVAVLGSSFDRLLADLAAPTDGPLPTALELVEPVQSAWTVGQMTLGFDADHDRFVLQLRELVARDLEPADESDEPDSPEEAEHEPDPDDDDRASARIYLSRGQAHAFARHAEQVVAAGRPACRFCGGPVDADGHACARMN